jgi:dTDP-4-amino-4,6-dideoxygalactose transaminase
MIPRFKPNIGLKELIAAISPKTNQIQEFESKFAIKFENQYGTMFQHGRTGIYALLKVWGLAEVEVICPAYTCVVVPHSIVLSGNYPVFIDCEEGSYNMDLVELENSISEKTRVIISTHLFGYPLDVIKLQEIVTKAEEKYKHKIYVIQDCAHSYGCTWNGELVTKYGDASIFGMNISKIMNSIFGGMVITNNYDTDTKLKKWRNEHCKKIGILKTILRFLYLFAVTIAFNRYVYSFVNYLERNGFLDRFTKYYDESKIEFPSDWDWFPSDMEARVGLVQLAKYDEMIETRRAIAKYWHDAKPKDVHLLPFNPEATYSHIVGVVENREELINQYLQKGIQLGRLIEYSIPEMRTYTDKSKGVKAKSKHLSNSLINFPVTGNKDLSNLFKFTW